jgi:hypothetical protein
MFDLSGDRVSAWITVPAVALGMLSVWSHKVAQRKRDFVYLEYGAALAVVVLVVCGLHPGIRLFIRNGMAHLLGSRGFIF